MAEPTLRDLAPVKTSRPLAFPEGPVALEDGSLLFVEIERQTLSHLAPDGTVSVVAVLPGGPNGLAIGPDGAAYVCNNGGVYTFVSAPFLTGTIRVPSPIPNPDHRPGSIQKVDLATGHVTMLYNSCDGKPLLTPDDIVFDGAGGFWFTDSGIQYPDRLERGGLYYATTDGKSIKRVATIPTANGIGLSPDGKTLYVSDTAFGRLWALNVTAPGVIQTDPLHQLFGMPGNAPLTLPSFQIPMTPSPPPMTAYQWLDSLKVDSDGFVAIGTLLNGGLTVFDPHSGSVEHIPVLDPSGKELPDPFITNLCFGGDDMQDVWITASSTGKIYKGRWCRPGQKPAYPLKAMPGR
jgi:gluconolactonase